LRFPAGGIAPAQQAPCLIGENQNLGDFFLDLIGTIGVKSRVLEERVMGLPSLGVRLPTKKWVICTGVCCNKSEE
jgi:hypothetical protein